MLLLLLLPCVLCTPPFVCRPALKKSQMWGTS